MITGIGTDIIYVSRIARVYRRYGDVFVRRILSLDEQELFYKKPVSKRGAHLAKAFAAKEAAAKALGTGFRLGVAYKDIALLRGDLGKPRIEFYGRALEIAKQRGFACCHISISDEKDQVLAFSVLEKA